MRKLRRLIAVLIAAALAPVSLLAQEAATVTGRVTNAQGQPEAAVLVRIESLNVGASTGADGNYRLVIPGARIRAGQSVQISASRAGLSPMSRTVTLSPGANLTQNFQLGSSVIVLEDLVVTGTAGETPRAKVPFDVGSVSAADIQVPTVSAAAVIQGKVAGAQVVSGSGRPGSAPSILLRGPKSLDASGRSQEPLYIVDGVILSGTLVDFNALDIEEVEVLKGAAAASLYGSRAANGVVQIRTRRGTGVPDNQVRYTARTEYGVSEMASTPEALLAEYHPYAMNAAGTKFLSSTGAECDWLNCNGTRLAGQGRTSATQAATVWNTYTMNAWPGQTYDQAARFFQDGNFAQQYVAAEGRTGATNFHVSYNNLADEGVMPGFNGYDRHNFRVNVDQAIRSDFSVSASAFYSRSTNDQFPEGNGNFLFDLTRMPAGVNLFACRGTTLAINQSSDCRNDPRNLLVAVNPANRESGNPVYEALNRDYATTTNRFLGASTLKYSPLSWFDLDLNASYDRTGYTEQDYFFKGFQTPTPSTTFNNGYLDRLNDVSEAFNASVTSTFRWDISSDIRNRTQFRYLYEQTDFDRTFTSGSNFRVLDIPNFQNIDPTRLGASNLTQPVRADGYFAITNFDIADRYIIDALIRNDGSSLFGEDERRQWYYRLATAWRVSDEPWFNVGPVSDLKFRYSYGTAGGRPSFAAQYETYSVSSAGISSVNLGNAQLKPEFSREHEVGLETGLFSDRLTLNLTYANSRTTDQILRVPLPAYTGFQSQWQNAGTLASNTWEASLNANLIQRGAFNWSARLLYDRTRSEITELTVPAYTYGVPGQLLTDVFYAREGEQMGNFYGVQYAQSCEQLPSGVDCGQFEVNDEGYLVYVGNGSLADRAWGTPAPNTVRGAAPHLAALNWGTPFQGMCNDRVSGNQVLYCPLGNTLPDYTVSFSSTLSYGGLTLYGLLDAVQGFDVYNQPLQWAVFRRTAGIFDQADVAADERKPIGYFDALYGVSGLGPSTVFVEDGSFVKLREMSLRYTFGSSLLDRMSVLNNFEGLSLMLTGRNLATWTDYRGFDPEVGSSGGNTGSSALARVEGYQYPNFRTWTLGVEVNF